MCHLGGLRIRCVTSFVQFRLCGFCLVFQDIGQLKLDRKDGDRKTALSVVFYLYISVSHHALLKSNDLLKAKLLWHNSFIKSLSQWPFLPTGEKPYSRCHIEEGFYNVYRNVRNGFLDVTVRFWCNPPSWKPNFGFCREIILFMNLEYAVPALSIGNKLVIVVCRVSYPRTLKPTGAV